MFFPERVRSVKHGDRVLEIGPGSTPHPRSDVLLEKIFNDEDEFRLQRGNTGPLQTSKPVVTYEGGVLPFKDKEFDFVICSHVLEHTSEPEAFLKEMFRVAKRGYLEFPTAYYDFVYNIPVHPILLLYKKGTIFWMRKHEAQFEKMAPFQHFLFETLKKEHFGMINTLRNYFVQGMEWEIEIECRKATSIMDLCYDEDVIAGIPLCKPASVSIGLKAELKRTFSRLFKQKT